MEHTLLSPLRIEQFVRVDLRDLRGKALDWLVALCLTTRVPTEGLASFTDGLVLAPDALVNFTPSTSAKDGEWIILKYDISVSHYESSPKSGWQDYSAIRGEHHLIGPDPLTAAMRCFVASFMGVSVEIPEVLAIAPDYVPHRKCDD